MKTSNKLLIAIGVLIMASIILFDTALRAEYLKGDYKNPNYGFVPVPLKDFDAIENYTSCETFTDVSQGGDKFEILVNKESEKDLAFTVENRVLKINFKTINSDKPRSYVIRIRCPRVNSISTKLNPGIKVIYMTGNMVIGVLKQDSLQIKTDAPGSIMLTPVSLKKIKVLMHNGELTMGGNGNLDTANFNIQGESKLNIENVAIGKVNYKFADKAKVTLSGNSIQQLMH